jgi:hypothetical protein
MLVPPLNETASFHVFFYKKNSVVQNDIVPLSLSPRRAAGEGSFFFFLQ